MMPNYIIDLIDKVTLHNKKTKWVAADLNAEMIFERLKKLKKDLFLIVLMRNPLKQYAHLYIGEAIQMFVKIEDKFFYTSY